VPRFAPEAREANKALVELLTGIAGRKDATPAQVALAWLLHRGEDVVPIPGTKRRRYLEENVGAADLALDERETAALDAALAPENVAGPRYDAARMTQIDR
jgi:aryl-alcohol dehydrogenase-like predicted oxidoreductase